MRAWILAVGLTLLSAGTARAAEPQDPQAPPAGVAVDTSPPPASWPRTYTKEGNTLVLHAPQIDSWKDHAQILFRMALVLTPADGGDAQYGVAAVKADTLTDVNDRTVFLTNFDVAVRFPGVADDKAAALKAHVKDCLPAHGGFDVPLDLILAHLHDNAKTETVAVNLEPPTILYSDVPAILVIYMGQPQFKPIAGTQLMFAVNTNWAVLMDMQASQYYLLDNDGWLTAPDPLKGPWTAAASLPADLSKLPEGAEWDDIRKNVPGRPVKSVPRVLTSTAPAELIATDGPPAFTPLSGTRLLYVSNPDMPLFLDLVDSHYYFLVSGRWFQAKDLTGPWAAASASLPAEFAKIPRESAVGFVLASIPKTQEAQDAVLLSTVPRQATVKIQGTALDVTYDGEPKFVAIPKTPMTYAVNTPYEVVSAEGQYYCCYQGVWFVAAKPPGPWNVCTIVPDVIYTIPPSCPIYNVTYVKLYKAGSDTVTVGYTSGYEGEYVSDTGALMFGAGYGTGLYMSTYGNYWYGLTPCFYSYGCAAHYDYGVGGYYRACGAYYGPHGGVGWGASYNPARGTWSRSAMAYGPAGAHWGSQAYNPFTNTYAAHTGGTNGYRSWGNSYVQRGDRSASAGHVSTAQGSAGWVHTSTGRSAAGVHTSQGGTAFESKSGNLYAGKDGNVYKRGEEGSWQKYQGNGNWGDAAWNKSAATANRQEASGVASEANWSQAHQEQTHATAANSWDSRSLDSSWKNTWESGSHAMSSNAWDQHATQMGLSQDAWARSAGTENAMSSWQSRSAYGGGFRGGFGGGFRGGRR